MEEDSNLVLEGGNEFFFSQNHVFV
jgi:hypothetical protein